MLMSKVSVVGGGPAGSLVSIITSRLGYSTTLYEEHGEAGLPRHCTGLVSSSAWRGLETLIGKSPSDLVVNAFTCYRVMNLDTGSELWLRFSERVLLVDRVAMDKALIELAGSEGVKVSFRRHVDNAFTEGSIVVAGRKLYSDLIVLAEGASMRLSRAAGLCGRPTYLRGLQAVADVKEPPENPVILVSRSIGREFFGWVVPLSGREVLVGLATEGSPYKPLLTMLRASVHEVVGEAAVKQFFGGLIPLNPPCRLAAGRLIGVGDSVSSVKPLTGGGIYPIVRQVEALRQALSAGEGVKSYVKRSRGLLKMLKRQHRYRKILLALGGYPRAVNILNGLGVKEVKVRNYDNFDVDLIDLLT